MQRLPDAAELIGPVHSRLQAAALTSLGADWLSSWRVGLPSWQQTLDRSICPFCSGCTTFSRPGTWSSTPGLAIDCSARGALVPRANADPLDADVSEQDLCAVLGTSPWGDRIPSLLRDLRDRLAGEPQQRLISV